MIESQYTGGFPPARLATVANTVCLGCSPCGASLRLRSALDADFGGQHGHFCLGSVLPGPFMWCQSQGSAPGMGSLNPPFQPLTGTLPQLALRYGTAPSGTVCYGAPVGLRLSPSPRGIATARLSPDCGYFCAACALSPPAGGRPWAAAQAPLGCSYLTRCVVPSCNGRTRSRALHMFLGLRSVGLDTPTEAGLLGPSSVGDAQISLVRCGAAVNVVPSSGRDPFGPSHAPSRLCGLTAAFAHSLTKAASR